jgi:hypothetical protein
MAHFMINKQPVVLFEQRHKELEQETVRAIQSAATSGVSVAAYLEPKAREKLMQEALVKKQREDPKGFYSQWVTFDISGEDAGKSVWLLLNEYCMFYGHGFLSGHRDLKQQIVLPEQRSDSSEQAVTKVFALNHFIPVSRWESLTKKKKNRVIQVVIDPRAVSRLVGNLRKFEVHTRSMRLVCGESIEIHPPIPAST